MHKGARREPIFFSDNLYVEFLDLLGELQERFELETPAYALMTNHYHLLVRSKHGNLSDAMRPLNANYTQLAKKARGFDGALFHGRFRSQLTADLESLPVEFAYIHLNPLQAGMITCLQSIAWTSYRAYLGLESASPWLHTDFFIGLFGDRDAMHSYILDTHRGKQPWPAGMRKESGWLVSSSAVVDARERPKETRFVDAQRVLEFTCSVCCCSLEDLLSASMGPRANPQRRFAVWALRKHTMLTQRETGKALDMSTQQVANVLRRIDVWREPFG